MRFVLVGVLLVFAFGACNGDPTRYPVNPGGGGGPPGLNGNGVLDPGDDGGDDDPPTDAPEDPTDGALPAEFAGRACLITDLRQPRANCDGTNAGMIDVRLVGANRSTSATAMDGTFTIGGQAMAQRYVLSRVDHIDTIGLFRGNATNQIMPFMSLTSYNTLLAANGVSAGGGGLVLEILDNANQPITGATVALVGFVTFYDANDPLVFGQVSTGPRGVAWLPQVPAGPVTVLVNPNNGKQPKNVTLESFDSATITHDLVVFQ